MYIKINYQNTQIELFFFLLSTVYRFTANPRDYTDLKCVHTFFNVYVKRLKSQEVLSNQCIQIRSMTKGIQREPTSSCITVVNTNELNVHNII